MLYKVALLSLLCLAGAHAADPAVQPSKTQRIPQFENKKVKVWKTIILPKQPLSYHRHESPRVVIALTDTRLRVVKEKSSESHILNWKKGSAHWLDADPAGELHGDQNESDYPMEVLVVEMKD